MAQMETVRILCLITGLLLVAASPAGTSLLERVALASGEPSSYHVVSETFSASEGHLIETRIETQGDRVLTHRCSGGVCSGSYLDGERSAIFSYNGTPIPQAAPVDPVALTLRAIASYAFASPSFVAAGGKVTELPQRNVGETVVTPFRVTAKNGATLQALVDPFRALVVAVVTDKGTLLLQYEDYRRVGTLMLPFVVRRDAATRIDFSERSIVNDSLVPPAGPPVSFAAVQNALELSAGASVPRFPCRIENVSATCLLDTGASGLAISLDLSDRLHKNPIGQIALEGLGTVLTGVVRVDSLELGSMRVGPALYAILPDVGGFKADIVVGADVIGRAVVRLDMRRHTLTFAPLGSRLEGQPIPLLFDGYTPTVAIGLGDLPTRLSLDTGDESSIDLPIDFYRAHPGLFTAREKRTVLGVGGRGTQSIGRIPSVRIGGFALSDVPIGATEIAGGTGTRARLGAEFLSRFVVELDYANARAALRPAEPGR